MTAGYKWKPLVRATQFTRNEKVYEVAMAHYGISREEAERRLARDEAGTEVWINDLYQIEVRRYVGHVVLNIRRRDGAAALRDWRHFQQIKNELVGPECEGVELYPAESRKVDTSNKYHLFVVTDPTFRFPFGWRSRDVQYEENRDVPGLRQRADTMKNVDDGIDWRALSNGMSTVMPDGTRVHEEPREEGGES